MMRWIFWLCFYLLSSQLAYGQVTPEQDLYKLGLSKDSLHKMEVYFHDLVDRKQLAGIQVGIIKDQQLVYLDTYGYADIEENIALTNETIFRIFSMTKPIVSVALMQLYEAGKFELDDPISDYLPKFSNVSVLRDSNLIEINRPVSIRHILTHTSGYNYGRSQSDMLNQYYANANIHGAASNDAMMERLSKVPLQFEPGTDWQYGYSTNICGYLIEKLSGQSLDEYLKDSIFIPLEMSDTHFQLPLEKVGRFTVGYAWDDVQGLFISEPRIDNRYTQKVTLFNGGGGLVSTALDYLHFCQMLLNYGEFNGHQILEEETVKLMFQDHIELARNQQDEPLRLIPGDAGFGLGFGIKGSDSGELLPVFGWGGAVGTYFKVDLANNMAYVMMIQLSPYRHLGLRNLIQTFINQSLIQGD